MASSIPKPINRTRAQSAKARCTNPNEPAFHNYGGRGIEFRFTSFDEFYAELGDKPSGMTLGRIDNNGHYEPGDVKWESRLAQSNNNRRNRPITAFGVMHNRKTWAKMINTPPGTLLSRLEKVLPEEALAHIRIPPGTFWVMEAVPAAQTYSATDSWRWKPYQPTVRLESLDATANAVLAFGV